MPSSKDPKYVISRTLKINAAPGLPVKHRINGIRATVDTHIQFNKVRLVLDRTLYKSTGEPYNLLIVDYEDLVRNWENV